MGGSRGGTGGPDPPEKSQKYRGFMQYGSKLPSKHSMSNHHRHASESPFKWRFTGGPMMARLYSGIWILPSKKKTLPSWTPSGDTFWIRAWAIYYAPVICNHCFTPAPEQDGDIHSLVNVLCFYFFIVPTMWRKCCGLIDIRQTWQCSIIADCGDKLSWFCQLAVPTVWWLLWGTLDTKSKSSTFLWAGAWSQMTSA